MQIVVRASNLDIDTWLRGLFSAGISGGASAVVGGFTVSGMDPAHYNFQEPNFYILVGALFATNAVVSIAKFLSTQPLPGVKEVEKTVQTITPATPDAPKIVETVTERHTEKMPIDAPKS